MVDFGTLQIFGAASPLIVVTTLLFLRHPSPPNARVRLTRWKDAVSAFIRHRSGCGRRALEAGLPSSTCCHTFRATGIIAYLENGGTIENAQAIAAQESPRTTKLYDRTSDEITLDEVERTAIRVNRGAQSFNTRSQIGTCDSLKRQNSRKRCSVELSYVYRT